MSALALTWFDGAPVSEPARAIAPVAADELDGFVTAARDGDVRAFEQLYRRSRKDAYRALYQLVGGGPDVEDLVQQVFVQLSSAIRRFRGDAKYSTFLYGICANVAMTHLRSRRRRPEDPVAELPERASTEGHDPERAAHTRQAAQLLQRVLDEMAPKKRVVFVYHELLGMTAEEIALSVDTSANTVRSRLHHARLEFAQITERMRKAGALP